MTPFKADPIFDAAWKKTGALEGGYVNHLDDPGGETNHGITQRVAAANGYHGKMSDLSPARALDIAKVEYWIKPELDLIAQISVPIAVELFDTNMNLWYGAAGKFLQRSLNALNRKQVIYPDLLVDGIMGRQTRDALTEYLKYRGKEGETVLLFLLNSLQCAEYMRQTETNEKKESFLYGWILNRCGIEE